MRSDDRAFCAFGSRHFDLCEAAGSVNNLIRQSPLDGKRVLKDEYMCRRRGSALLMCGSVDEVVTSTVALKVRLLNDLCLSVTTRAESSSN